MAKAAKRTSGRSKKSPLKDAAAAGDAVAAHTMDNSPDFSDPPPSVEQAYTGDPEALARAREDGRLNDETPTEPQGDPGDEDIENKYTGDADAIERARRDGRLDDSNRTDTPAAPEVGELDVEVVSGSGRAKAKIGQIVNYVSSARRAGIRNSQARAAIVTHVDDDGSVSLTVFDVDGERRVRKVTSNRNAEEHWRA